MDKNNEEDEDDDEKMMYLEEGFATLARCLGEDFGPFLPRVVGPTLRRAAEAPETQDLCARPDLAPGWDVAAAGAGDGERVGVHTAQVEAVAAALGVLGVYAECLPRAFVPYAEALLRAALPHLRRMPFDALRRAAYGCLPGVVACARAHGDPAVLARAWRVVRAALTERLPLEIDNDVLAHGLGALADCVALFGAGTDEAAAACFEDAAPLTALGNALAAVLDEWQDDVIELYDMAHEAAAHGATGGGCSEDEFDDEGGDGCDGSSVAAGDLRHVDAAEKEVLEAVKDALCAAVERVAANQRGAFYGVYQQCFARRVRAMARARSLMLEKQLALYLMAVVCEQCPFAAFNAVGDFAPHFLHYAADMSDTQLRQEALYGLGALAATLGPAFAPYLAPALQRLAAVLRDPRARTGSRLAATETAAAALAKVLLAHDAHVPAAPDVFAAWLRHLPLRGDEDEARACHHALVLLLQRPVFASAAAASPAVRARVAKIFAGIVGTPLLAPADAPAVRAALVALAPALTPDAAAAEGLTPQDRDRLTAFVSDSSSSSAPPSS